ncbi:hypothetical protein E1A91_D11G286400v1, partial [Gossypium mustelinum]
IQDLSPPPRERTDLPLQLMPWLEASKTHIQSKRLGGGVGALIAEKLLSGTHLVLGENMDWLVLLQQRWGQFFDSPKSETLATQF